MSDFEEKLNAILSSPETMEQISAIASSLSGGAKQSESGDAPPDNTPVQSAPDLSGLGDLLGGLDSGMLERILPLVREYQAGNDEKQALLNALKLSLIHI